MFVERPSGGCICAICHDVLQDASALNCGHTFCNECIKSLGGGAGGKVCPNCRVAVTSSNPNYAVRDIIDAMQVRCPLNLGVDGGGDDNSNGDSYHDHEEGNADGGGNACSKKRKRDNDGDVPRGCSWTGQLQNLRDHEGICGFKVISCSVEGCQHSCMRKDMVEHLSGTAGAVMHLSLSYERKLAAMEGSYERKLRDIEKKYDGKLKELESSCVTLHNDSHHERAVNDEKCKKLESNMYTWLYHERYEDDCRSLKECNRDDFPLEMKVFRIRRRDMYYFPTLGLVCVFVFRGAWIPVVYRKKRDPVFHSTLQFPPGFFHLNVDPKGVMYPNGTFREILYSVQNLLMQPDQRMIRNPEAGSLLQSGEYNSRFISGILPYQYDSRIKYIENQHALECAKESLQENEYIDHSAVIHIPHVPSGIGNGGYGGRMGWGSKLKYFIIQTMQIMGGESGCELLKIGR